MNDIVLICRRLVAAKLTDSFMSMEVLPRVWAQEEVDECNPHVIANPSHASPGMFAFACKPEVDAMGPYVQGLKVHDTRITDKANAALFLELVVTLHTVAAPFGFDDVFGTNGLEFRQNAVALFLERHNKRSVLCMTLRSAKHAADDNTVCSLDIGTLLIPNAKWDVPPFAHLATQAAPINSLLWPRLRFRVVADPGVLGARSSEQLDEIFVSAWIRDRDDPTVVYARTQ